MGTTLTTNCKQLLAGVLRENMEVFAWTRSERTAIPRFVIKHQLKIYPFVEPMVHKRFLRLLKDYRQIRMAKDNEEKTRFQDDGEGLSQSKRTERGNILGGSSNKKQKCEGGKVP
ncbi:hypothetical protein Tco_0095421 [Tanacetum coccineum]